MRFVELPRIYQVICGLEEPITIPELVNIMELPGPHTQKPMVWIPVMLRPFLPIVQEISGLDMDPEVAE
ncbi:hypothetical protein ES705_35971 [subsurface metagenome]